MNFPEQSMFEDNTVPATIAEYLSWLNRGRYNSREDRYNPVWICEVCEGTTTIKELREKVGE